MMLSPDIREILIDPDLGGGLEFKVHRKSYGHDHGRAIISSDEVYTCRGNIQPAQIKDLQQMSDEDRSEEVIVIRSEFHFKLGAGDPLVAADEVEFNGKMWRVTRVDDWSPWGYTSAWATLLKGVTP